MLKCPRSMSFFGFVLISHFCCCCVWLFATPWTAAHQASLFFTISWSVLKLFVIESVVLSSHLILCHCLLLLPLIPDIWIFSNESALLFSVLIPRVSHQPIQHCRGWLECWLHVDRILAGSSWYPRYFTVTYTHNKVRDKLHYRYMSPQWTFCRSNNWDMFRCCMKSLETCIKNYT